MARKPSTTPGIGKRLKALRTRLGWSQLELSDRSGLRRTEISIIEQGRNKGSSFRVRTLLARAFGAREALDAYWAGSLALSDLLGLQLVSPPDHRLGRS